MRPPIVTIAIVALYVQNSIGVVLAIFRLSHPAHAITVEPAHFPFLIGFRIVLLILFTWLMFWFTYKIGQGRNWARVTWLVLLLLGLCFFFVRPASVNLGDFIWICVDVVIAFMLFSRDARPWFQQTSSDHLGMRSPDA